MANKTFYVTTPIYYTNADPHVGAAYTTIAADILARWNKLLGKEVFFLTGTDEHGQKIQEIAEKAGKSPKEFVNNIASKFQEAFKLLNISNDYFIRTTNPEHEKEVKKILQELYKKKFIYKGFYEACYCVGCEQYLTKSDLIGGKCPLHLTEPKIIKEEAYLFKLSAFQDKLLKLIKTGEYKILPKERRKEIITFIESGLQDISISRLKEKVYWGIELPFDKKHTCFVWVDAFWNYLTGLQINNKLGKFWPPDVQLMAKDIFRVHATIWPALLLATENKLPKTLFVHGYFTVNGQKMGKSLGNVISPIYLVNQYGADSVRYFLMRNISFGQDGDFSEQALIDRHNNELADKLGNLVSRVSTLIEKLGLEKSSKNPLKSKDLQKAVEKHFENLEFDKALNEIFSFIDKCNIYVQETKPWESGDKEVLYNVASAIKDFTILISPFIPETAEKIAKTFNFEINYKSLNKPLKISKIKKSEILFKKIEQNIVKTAKPIAQQAKKLSVNYQISKQVQKQNNKLNKPKITEGIITMADIVKYEEFKKLDLKVGTIKKAEDIAKADNLLKLEIDLGREKRTIVAGIKKFYSKDELKGKQIIVVCNLEPRVMKGVESRGMLLAAVSDDESKIVLISPEKNINSGTKVQ